MEGIKQAKQTKQLKQAKREKHTKQEAQAKQAQQEAQAKQEQQTKQAKQAKKGIWGRILSIYRVLTANRYTTVAGTLAFFFVLSAIPFLFWLILLFGRVAFDPELLSEIPLFHWAKDLLVLLFSNAGQAGRGTDVLFLAATLWSSTGFFYHLRRSGEILYAYKREKEGWRVRISALLLTVFLLFFFAAAGSALVIFSFVARRLPVYLAEPLRYLLILALGFAAATLLNAYVCPYRCRMKDIALGSFFTALSWLVASGAFALYVNFSNKEKLYGALTLVIVFLIWLYWMMICFTAGAVYNRTRMPKDLQHKTL